MAEFVTAIDDFYAGDSLTIDPDIAVTDPSAIDAAYLTVKVSRDDDDVDAVLTKTISTVASDDGIIVPNSGAGTVNTRFDLTNTETLLLSPLTNPDAFATLEPLQPLLWEILIVTSAGNDYRAQGTIRAKGARLLQGH